MIQRSLSPMSETEPIEESTRQDQSFGSLYTDEGHLPLAAMDVRARIVGLISHVTVEQTFENALRKPLEATYVFPLPDRSAVTRFQLHVGDRVVEGVLQEREKAREEYEQAIRKGHRAAIAEEDRPDVFTMRVGNLMPGERARVHLTLTGPVPVDEGEATFRFPLVVAPRYIPGVPLEGASVGDGVAPDTDAVPDASRITPPVLLPGFPNPVRLSLEVEVDPAGLPVGQLRSSLHAIEEDLGPCRRVRVRPGERLDRDFILRFPVGAETVVSTLMLQPDEASGAKASGAPDPEGDGTFTLTILPPRHTGPASRARSVIFVLDRSGSMAGWKLVAARRALARMLDSLGPADRFQVYAFDHVLETFDGEDPTQLITAIDRNRYRAIEYLATLEARGGTEMSGPIGRAVATLRSESDRDRILVLVTDGQIGNEEEILRQVADRGGDTRVFALGVDRAVNAGFLRRLAGAAGICEMVESEDRLDEVMRRIHRRIATPVVTGLEIHAEGLSLVDDTVTPRRPPDLFEGAPTRVAGRYRGAARGELRVSGVLPDGSRWRDTVEPRIAHDPALTTVWARSQVRELEDQLAVAPQGRRRDLQALQTRLVDTSLRFGVLCRFTAFVGVDASAVVNEGGRVHRIIQPVETPEAWDMAFGTGPEATAPTGFRLAQDFVAASGSGPAADFLDALDDVAPRARLMGRSPSATRILGEALDEVLATIRRIGAMPTVAQLRLLQSLLRRLHQQRTWPRTARRYRRDLALRLRQIGGVIDDEAKIPREGPGLVAEIEALVRRIRTSLDTADGATTRRNSAFWRRSGAS